MIDWVEVLALASEWTVSTEEKRVKYLAPALRDHLNLPDANVWYESMGECVRVEAKNGIWVSIPDSP